MDRGEAWSVAVHEAAHLIASLALPVGLRPVSVTVRPRRHKRGHLAFDRASVPKERLLDPDVLARIGVAILAGPMAAARFCGSAAVEAPGDDLEKLAKLGALRAFESGPPSPEEFRERVLRATQGFLKSRQGLILGLAEVLLERGTLDEPHALECLGVLARNWEEISDKIARDATEELEWRIAVTVEVPMVIERERELFQRSLRQELAGARRLSIREKLSMRLTDAVSPQGESDEAQGDERYGAGFGHARKAKTDVVILAGRAAIGSDLR